MTRYQIALFNGKYIEECHVGRHRWYSEGGRPCPKGVESCSQAVYRCFWCGGYDYGELSGPGYEECKNCTLKPDPLIVAYNKAKEELMNGPLTRKEIVGFRKITGP